MPSYKIPLVSHHDWWDNEDSEGRHIQITHLSDYVAEQTGIACMTIRRSAKGSQWQLRLYDKLLRSVEVCECEPVRTVNLGKDGEDINYTNEAILKFIEIASVENGQDKNSMWRVDVPIRSTRTHLVEAKSYQEAVAQVAVLYENEMEEAEVNGELSWIEYVTDDITAELLEDDSIR